MNDVTARPQDVALLPLPEWCLDDDRALYVLEGMSGPQYRNDMEDYARANVTAALASAQAREEELRAANAGLLESCSERQETILTLTRIGMAAEARAERLEEALRAARQCVYMGDFPLGWTIDRIDAALSTNAATQTGETNEAAE